MKATFVPAITVSVAVLLAYHLGSSTGIGDGRNAGLFGTAVATMGMLSNAVYILSMNNFGPIADNAGGITEMSMQPEEGALFIFGERHCHILRILTLAVFYPIQ